MAGLIWAQSQAGGLVEGGGNRDAVRAAAVVILAVPAVGQRADAVAPVAAGWVFVDTSVCHHPRLAGTWQPPPHGWAAARVRHAPPSSAAVAASPHTVPARAVRSPDRFEAGHVLCCAESLAAADGARALLEAPGVEAVEARGLEAALEHLAVLLAGLSARHGSVAPGVPFLGLPAERETVAVLTPSP